MKTSRQILKQSGDTQKLHWRVRNSICDANTEENDKAVTWVLQKCGDGNTEKDSQFNEFYFKDSCQRTSVLMICSTPLGEELC